MKRKYFIVGLIIIFLAIVVSLATILSRNNNTEDLVTSRDTGLTAEENQQVSAEIQSTLDQLKGERDDVKRFQAYLLLGDQYRNQQGDFVKARDAYEEASKLQPDNVAALMSLYRVSADMKDYQNAERYIDQLIKVDPVNTTMYQGYRDTILKTQ